MLENSALDEVADVLIPKHFYSDARAIIYTAILKLNEAAIRIDAITIAEELDWRNQLEGVGGVPYLIEIVAATPQPANIKHYADIVIDKWIRRTRTE